MRSFIGLIIILAGIGLLLEAAGVGSFDTIAKAFWPLVVMAIGVMAWRSNPRAFTGPTILIMVGAILLLTNYDRLPGSAWNYLWPIVIMLFGFQILFGKFGHPKARMATGGTNAFAAFSGVEERTTGTYTGGTANAWFGGVKLDLREADIQDGAVLQVWAAFGGIELLVPRNVKVTTSVLPLFGGAENKTTPDPAASKTLHINGTAMFGGVGVKN